MQCLVVGEAAALSDRRVQFFAFARFLFNDLIGDGEQVGRHGKAERLGSFEVEHHLEPSYLLHRQVGGLFALENSRRVDALLSKRLRPAAAIAYQAAGYGRVAKREDRGQTVAKGQFGKLLAPPAEKHMGAKREIG
jgi:hypothetical protein